LSIQENRRRLSGSELIPFIQGNPASDDFLDFPNHHAKLWNRVFIIRWQSQPMTPTEHELMP